VETGSRSVRLRSVTASDSRSMWTVPGLELQDRFLHIGGIPILGLREPQALVRVPPEFQAVFSKSSVTSSRLPSQLNQALRREERRKLGIPRSLHRSHRVQISGEE